MASQTWSIILVIICALQISVVTKVKSYHGADKISSLPGQPKVSFQQYSGYIAVDEKQKRWYFYYFVEAENDPASKPIVLWLNGGPGCSSVGVGAFTENGPFHPSGNVLVKNDHSWNRVANMLYLESPAGVGFSYSADKSFYKSVNDNMTAKDNFNFLKNWFKKFPEFKNNELYITGESYAGHYAPQLANLIIQSKLKLNLKGIAMGNPLLEFDTDFNAVSEYLWSHGLISDYTFDQLNRVCNYSQIRRQNDKRKWTRDCSRVKDLVLSETSKYIDTFDVTLDVCLPSNSMQSQLLSQMQDDPKVDVCVVDETKVYLSRRDVQRALHARLVGVSNWTICTSVMRYKMQNLEIPTIGLLGSLVEQGIRVLAYSGDQDSVIPLTGTRKLINGLAQNLNLKTTQPYSVWLAGKQWMRYEAEMHSFEKSQELLNLSCIESVVGHKPMVTFYHLQRYEELPMMPHFLNRLDHLSYSVRS
ncbi:serine carboxypeptidase-like 45 [Phtheirospermum japonicum]|uniref:Carboxypeptidase n=1 Tax=Phtheirospermum japonicum TaxID=374723 RepID=A0A830BD05_9LAMI|nr:serine carboxypeptidase-like 45 [Phtheirospermum japonicum]